jgi:hypothetical protein
VLTAEGGQGGQGARLRGQGSAAKRLSGSCWEGTEFSLGAQGFMAQGLRAQNLMDQWLRAPMLRGSVLRAQASWWEGAQGAGLMAGGC